ncbi:MAG: HAD-IA family hydrolase [Actinomycetota bacterium]
MRFKTVFFDAGETLVHPHPSFPELFSKVLAEHGHAVDPERVRERMHVVSERFKQAAEGRELWSTDAGRSREFWLSVYRLFLEDARIPSEEGLDVVLYAVFSDHANYALFDDVEPALAALEAAGVSLGVISNFEDWLEVLLERLDVTRYFPVRVISGVVGVEKPDPRIFELALEQAGVAAEGAVYVGDSPHFDVGPAVAVGMFPVLIDRRDRFADPEIGARIRSLDELPALIGI